MTHDFQHAEDSKSIEHRLEQSETELRAVLENIVEGIITIDAAGIIRSMNPAVERIFGYGAEELSGRNISILMPLPYREEHDSYIRKYLETFTG